MLHIMYRCKNKIRNNGKLYFLTVELMLNEINIFSGKQTITGYTRQVFFTFHISGAVGLTHTGTYWYSSQKAMQNTSKCIIQILKKATITFQQLITIVT